MLRRTFTVSYITPKCRGILSDCAILQLQHTFKDTREVLYTRKNQTSVPKLKTNRIPNLHM